MFRAFLKGYLIGGNRITCLLSQSKGKKSISAIFFLQIPRKSSTAHRNYTVQQRKTLLKYFLNDSKITVKKAGFKAFHCLRAVFLLYTTT